LKKCSVIVLARSDLARIWIYTHIPVTKKRVLVVAPPSVTVPAVSVPGLAHRTTRRWLVRHLGCCLARRNTSPAATTGWCWCRWSSSMRQKPHARGYATWGVVPRIASWQRQRWLPSHQLLTVGREPYRQ